MHIPSYWTPKMVRVMFDYIEEEAGDDSLFITDIRKAWQNVLIKLEPVTAQNDYKSLNVDKILVKLYKEADKAGKPGASGRQTLYREGKACLRLWKITRGVFTEEEIEESRVKHCCLPT